MTRQNIKSIELNKNEYNYLCQSLFSSKLILAIQWGALSEVIAPEVHQLVKEWDTLSSDTRGELA